MSLAPRDRSALLSFYSRRYKEFGVSPQSLGWTKGKQDLRFEILTSFFPLEGKRILDVGCGFGDLNAYLGRRLKSYEYLGIDVNERFVSAAKKQNKQACASFQAGDFLSFQPRRSFDVVVASGVFSLKLRSGRNASFIKLAMRKAFGLCAEGLAFDFLSGRVDFRYPENYYADPEFVLAEGYKLSRNLVLRNDYMPFEFALAVFKDDSFQREDTVFARHKRRRTAGG